MATPSLVGAGPRTADDRAARLRLPRPRWADLALVPAAVGTWLLLRRWAVGQPLWLDEQYVAVNVRERGYLDLVGELDYVQSAPLGWLWAERTVLLLLGDGERALRLPSLTAGVATLLVAWWIGRRWLGAAGAVVLVAACACCPSLLRYAGELKPYPVDALAALLLLALAGWALDDPRGQPGGRRLTVWWAAAVAAGWFSTAAVLVVPGYALVLVAVAWRRGGARAAALAAAGGLAWLASFGLNYLLVLRHALAEPILHAYWAPRGFPPEPYSLAGLRSWVSGKLAAVAVDAGAVHPRLFWLLVAAGVVAALRTRRDLVPLLVAPPATAVVLAVARVSPLAGRLALWLVPVLLVAVAAGPGWVADVAFRIAPRIPPTARRPRVRAVVAVAAGVAVVTSLGATAVVLRPAATASTHPPPYGFGVDDRAAIRTLAALRRDGDIVLIDDVSWSAVDWYADLAELRPVYPVAVRPVGPGCYPIFLLRAVLPYRRVVLYTGIRLPSRLHAGRVLAARVAALGAVVEDRSWGSGRLLVVDLAGPPGVAALSDVVALPPVRATCVTLLRPRHWPA